MAHNAGTCKLFGRCVLRVILPPLYVSCLLTQSIFPAPGLLSSLRPPMRGGRQRRPDKESNFSFRGLNRYFTENYS